MIRKIISKINLPPIALFFGIVTILFSWFRYGLIYGGGDIGLPLYDPSLSAEISKFIWWSGQGTGFSYPAISSSYPFYLVLSIFQKIGFTPFLIQVLFFFSVLILSGFGIFYLGKILTKDPKVSFLASIFYLINPYTMMNIWHRFAHTSMILMAFIPWTLIFLYRGLKERKILYVFILAATSLIGAYAFGTPAFLATWWFLFLAFWGYLFLIEGRRQWKFYLFFLICFLFLWLGFNLWWLYPFIKTAPVALFINASSSGNIESLRGVSRYFTLPFAFRGINSFYLTEQVDWGKIYLSPFFKILSWLGTGVILASLFIKKKSKYFFFFGFLFLTTIFVSKGSEMPLGNLVVFAFTLFPYLGAFRNPFEKFGVLLPLASSFLFAYGVDHLWKSVKLKRIPYFRRILLILLVGFFAVYHWPMWTGNVFGSLEKQAMIKVPQDYEKAGKWFREKNDLDLRILHLPLAIGDGITYKWEHGYNGLESSQLFFPGSSISHFLGYELVDRRFQEIAESVRNKDKELFKSLLLRFGINNIVFHKDVDFSVYRVDTAENIEQFLDSLDFVKKEKEIGSLVIYSVIPREDSLGRIFFADNFSVTAGDLSYFANNFIVKDSARPNVYIKGGDPSKTVLGKIDYILPTHVINYPVITVSKENAIKEMPYVRWLPGSVFYPFIRAKENILLLGKTDEERFLTQLNYTSKRLVEVFELLKRSEDKSASQVLDEYQKKIEILFPSIEKKLGILRASNDLEGIKFYQVMLFRQREALRYHILPLATGELREKTKKTLEFLDEKLSDAGLVRLYPLSSEPPSSTTFRFEVDENGEYLLLLKRKDWEEVLLSKSGLVEVFTDGLRGEIEAEIDDKFIGLGPFILSKGKHEISVSANSVNLIKETEDIVIKNRDLVLDFSKDKDSFKIISKSEENFVEFELPDIDPDSFYSISFEYWVERGLAPTLSVIQDVDPIRDGKPRPSLEKRIQPDGYEFYWKNLTTSYRPSSFAHKIKIRISLKPWNNCEEIYWRQSEKCKDREFSRPYDRTSVVRVRNLVVNMVPTRGAVLVPFSYTKNLKSQKDSAVDYLKINPTKYLVNFKEKKKGLLVFRETYTNDWVLRGFDGEEIPAQHVLVDGYANGWIVEDVQGKIFIEFKPQKRVKQGFLYGFLLVFLAGYIVWRTKDA